MKLVGTASALLAFGGQAISGWNYYHSAPPIPLPPLGAAELVFHKYDELKAFKGGICVNTLLNESEKGLLNRQYYSEQQWKSLHNKFQGAEGEARGCVAVSWHKQNFNHSQWKGTIRYEWIFSVGDHMAVAYGFYNTEERGANISWKITYIDKRRNQSAGLFRFIEKKDIPQRPTFAPKMEKYWGFNPDFNWSRFCWKDDMCKGEMLNEKSDETKWTWKEDEEGKQRFSDWSQNFWDAFDNLLLHEHPSMAPIKELINSKKGVWSKR